MYVVPVSTTDRFWCPVQMTILSEALVSTSVNSTHLIATRNWSRHRLKTDVLLALAQKINPALFFVTKRVVD